jgi:hypothetical protein
MERQERSNGDSGSRGADSEGEEQAPDTMLRLDQLQYGAPQQMQYLPPSQPAAPYTQQAGALGPAAQQQQQQFGPWVKYYIQRVTTNINHVLFYCVDEAGMAKLAVVVRFHVAALPRPICTQHFLWICHNAVGTVCIRLAQL